MFHSKKIKKIESEISDIKNELKKLQNKISSQDKIIKLQSKGLDDISDLLDSKEFSKNWEDYLKYKEMKEQLPDIETMYKLKKLKQCISLVPALTADLIQANQLVADALQKVNAHWLMMDGRDRLAGEDRKYDFAKMQIKENEETIKSIIEFLKAQKDTDLQALFKLYAIDAEWLHP